MINEKLIAHIREFLIKYDGPSWGLNRKTSSQVEYGTFQCADLFICRVCCRCSQFIPQSPLSKCSYPSESSLSCLYVHIHLQIHLLLHVHSPLATQMFLSICRLILPKLFPDYGLVVSAIVQGIDFVVLKIQLLGRDILCKFIMLSTFLSLTNDNV